MFNIGLGELLFIAILALIFIGPERLPQVLRQLGEAVYKLRMFAAEVTSQFGDELEPLRELQSLANDLDPRRQIGSLLDTNPRTIEQDRQRTIAPPKPAAPAPGSIPSPMAQLTQARQAASQQVAGETGDTSPPAGEAGEQEPEA